MSERIFNFSPGPAVLPLEVVETVRENLANYRGSGLGMMEMSHRGPQFEEIITEAEARLRRLLSIGDDYAVIFTTGGATNQFSMVPMNFLGRDQVADYIVTGTWAKKALQEAQKFGRAVAVASSEDDKFTRIPTSFAVSQNSAYLHFTSNNTVAGTQFHREPQAKAGTLVCDASSDFLHKSIDITKYGLIYAGAQKNLGPAGVALVVARKDWLSRIPQGLPIMMDYRTYTESGSMYNTPPTLPIYVVGEVLRWIETLGLAEIESRNAQKAALLYQRLDRSEFFVPVVSPEDRSLMNVTFRLQNEELEKKFIEESSGAGLHGLQGHRSVGGMRASIYNAFPIEGVRALVAFMDEFERRYG